MDFVDNNIQKAQVQPKDQVYARNEDIKVYGKLVSMSTENAVADSEQIWDKILKKNQSDINSVTQSKFGEYLPLAGGRIDGNLGVTGRVDLGGPLEIGLGINASTITVDDGNNSANFTPTSIELGLGDSNVNTHISAQEIITDKISVTAALPSIIYDVSITSDRIQISKDSDTLEYTIIRPSGIITNGSIRLKNGTDQDVLLGDGSTTDRLIKDVTAAAIQSEYNFDFITTGNVNNFVTIKAATSTTAGVMTAADKKALDNIPNTYANKNEAITNITITQNENTSGIEMFCDYAGSRVGEMTAIDNATSTVDGLMSSEDKVKLDNVAKTYLPLSGGTLTGTLRLNDINSDENGLDINNVNGIQSVDQDKVLTPEVWTTNGNSIPLNIANGIAKLDQNGNIPLKNLGNIDTQIALVVDKLPTTDIKTNKIYLVRKNETGQDNAYIEYVYINNSWEKFGEYTPSIDLSEYSLKSQTVSQAAFVANSGNTQLQLTNANGSKSSVYVPIAETPGVSSSGQLISGQNGFMSVYDKIKLDGIAESANNYVLKKATASDLGGIKIGFTGNSSSKNYPVTLDLNGKAYVHVPWTDTQTDISNCVKNNEDGIINGDLTVNGNLSTSNADIVIDSGKLELHSASDGIKFVDNEDSVYISTINGSANEYFATDGSIQTIQNNYLPLSGGTVTGGITVNGAINTKSNITTDGTVTAKGFVSKTEKNPHEVWACNGGSINLKTIIASTAVYVHGSIVESIAGSINLGATIEDPDAIIFNKATGSFVAKKNNGYYRYWNTVDNLLINDQSKYGTFFASRGIVPYHKQLYIFANDNANIYIADNTGSISTLDIYIN